MEINFLNKIKKDKIYSKLLSVFKIEEEFLNAGFFCDNIELPIDHRKGLNSYLIPKIRKETDAIIIQTGSFAPYHSGHFQNLELAKSKLNASGYFHVQGLICPDHDEYVVRKVKDENFNIHNRISWIQKNFIKSWISVDTWMGIGVNTSVNFTEQILHIKEFLLSKRNRENLKTEIPIFYLCGGDNANFWRTFLLEGHCIIVSRGTNDEKFEFEKSEFEKLCLENSDLKNRIIWIVGNSEESSSRLRQNFEFDKLKEKAIIRTNGSEIELKVIEILKNYFEEISIVNIDEQKIELQKYLIENIQDVNTDCLISLDSEIPLKYNIRVSRKFEPFGINKIGYFIDENKTNLPEDKEQTWFLFDDDSCSGGTFEFVRNYLIDLGFQKISTEYKTFVKSESDIEIIDARDFLIEFNNSGLVVELPNSKISRVPYIFPLISTFQRCSILDLNFSKEILNLNVEYWKFFKNEYPKFQNNLWNFLGFENLTNYEICLKLKELNEEKLF